MNWFKKQRPNPAEALELELAGIASGSAAGAEPLAMAEALRRTASSLPAPTKLRARRAELLAVGTAAAGRRGRLRRVVRPVVLTAVIAILLAAAALGAAVISSWVQADEYRGEGAPVVIELIGHADGAASQSGVQPGSGFNSDPDNAGSAPLQLPDADAERRSAANRDCGEDALAVTLAECQAALESAVPTASPSSTADELLAMLVAACGEGATLPDLTGLDDASATALVEALVAECEAALTLP